MKKKSSKKKTVIDVLSHVLVSKMAVLPEGEKTKVLKKYSITEDQLPVIRHTDPEAVALKAQPGNVIRIQREGETGDYISYKVVV